MVELQTSALVDREKVCDEGAAGCADLDMNTVYVVEDWYNKHYDGLPVHLGLLFVHEMTHIIGYQEHGGDVRTSEECYQDEANAENQEARWIIEHEGKLPAKRFESVRAYLLGTQLERMKGKKLWREYCEQYPAATPTPTPQPAGSYR